jgi:2-isopropylmalate synthase
MTAPTEWETMTRTKRRIEVYDTTLRDGSQGEGISFSVEDKVKIALKLDEFGVDVIEGGWPGSNPKDIDFFARIKSEKLTYAKLAAFGSTRRPNKSAADDPMIRPLIEAETPVVCFVGKSWDFQVTEALRIELDENLRMIADTVAYLKSQGKIVYYDAEHFFDGYKENSAYTLSCLRAAADAGVDACVLCDTNGGTLPLDIHRIVTEVRSALPAVGIGIHTHNDSECGVANTLVAIEAGAIQVQGTINGYGERTGNANLTSILPALALKMGYDVLKSAASIGELSEVSAYIDEISNVTPRTNAAYVGRSAFAHKAGLHVDGIRKHPKTYEHIDPTAIGNERRFLVSELSGSATVLEKLQKYGGNLTKSSPETRVILEQVATLENDGYSFEGAEASFELVVKKALGEYRPLFTLKGYRVIVEKRGGDDTPITEATLKIEVNGAEHLTVAEGDGPVNALDAALRKALSQHYPDLAGISLTDFKVRVLNQKEGTAAKVRAIVESADHAQGVGDKLETWSTVGVSTNVIEASWRALVESVEYGLLRHK